MTTIGPTLPPHLISKRKRSSSPSPPNSPSTSSEPPSKRSRPSSPSSPPPPKCQPIGPALPPAPLSELPTTPLSDNEPHSPGPSYPATNIPPSTTPPLAPPTTTRPSLPPTSSTPASESSDDDDFGPSPAPPPGSSSAAHESARQAHLLATETAAALALANAPPKREEWMLAPPSNMDWGSRVDPTRLKNRKFQTGKSARAPQSSKEGGAGVDRLWTETPQQKMERLKDEVLGVKPRAENAAAGQPDGRERKDREVDEEKARRVREYNERRDRGGSLMDGWKGKRERGEEGSGEKEDDPSARKFDREKDVGLAVKVGHKARGEMMHKAKDFGGRFAGGKYL